MKNYFKKFKDSFHQNEEKNARRTMIEDLLVDMNNNRFSVYKMSFFRGIFFGFGSVIGGTIVIAALIWVLTLTGQLIPGLEGMVVEIVNVVESATN